MHLNHIEVEVVPSLMRYIYFRMGYNSELMRVFSVPGDKVFLDVKAMNPSTEFALAQIFD